ncbi:hypothetical protein [Microbacterium timonense]|uniref:hypothetical protein n=1 Tax=Microbacterium timonense TaxID=2086576 RepID=UPI000D0F3F6C|nr:hypothetical protein [Microbacterium timonense]
MPRNTPIPLRPSPLARRAGFLLAALTAILLALQFASPAPARAAERGVGFGTWAPISAYGWHGSMLIDGVHTYCITPGAPAPTGPSSDHGISGSAAGLSPQQLAGINLLVTRYGQTDDPVQAAAVAWAVKAIANREETLHAFGYRGDSLAGAIHWTFSALAPHVDRAVQERAVAYYDEALRVSGAAASATGTVVFTTDAADHRTGTVRVDATVPATGSLTLVDAVFADTGSPTRDGVTTGTDYAIRTTPSAEGRPYTVSASGRFSAGVAAAVRHYTTPGGQETAGPAGSVDFDVAGADAAPRVPPFAPSITTTVPARYAAGGAYVDHVTISTERGSWPRAEDGAYLPVRASATVYRTDSEPVPGSAVPADAHAAGILELVTDPATGPEAPYAVTSEWSMDAPGFYTAVWTVRAADQTPEVALHLGADYTWTEPFGEPTQVTLVPAVSTQATPAALVGEPLSDTIRVTGGVPSGGLWVRSALYRAVDGVPPGESCTPENLVWQSEPAHLAAAGEHVVTSPRVADAGTYYWQETAADAAGALVHTGRCGIENETSRVTAPTPPPAAGASLAATGLGDEMIRTSAAMAIGLLTLGVALLASPRPGRRAASGRLGAPRPIG